MHKRELVLTYRLVQIMMPCTKQKLKMRCSFSKAKGFSVWYSGCSYYFWTYHWILGIV